MQPLCAVSRASTKVTISKHQTPEVIVDNGLLLFAVSIWDYFANIIFPESHILPDSLTIPYYLLNDWDYKHHGR